MDNRVFKRDGRPLIQRSVTCEGLVLTDLGKTFLGYHMYERDDSDHDGDVAVYLVKDNVVHGMLHIESEGGAYDTSKVRWAVTEFSLKEQG